MPASVRVRQAGASSWPVPSRTRSRISASRCAPTQSQFCASSVSPVALAAGLTAIAVHSPVSDLARKAGGRTSVRAFNASISAAGRPAPRAMPSISSSSEASNSPITARYLALRRCASSQLMPLKANKRA
jgi:hypothetical protein